jgi:hypothetical protein
MFLYYIGSEIFGGNSFEYFGEFRSGILFGVGFAHCK